jgi:hypothetical protein
MYCNTQSNKVLEESDIKKTQKHILNKKKLSHSPQSDVMSCNSSAELWPTNGLILTLGIYNLHPFSQQTFRNYHAGENAITKLEPDSPLTYLHNLCSWQEMLQCSYQNHYLNAFYIQNG